MRRKARRFLPIGGCGLDRKPLQSLSPSVELIATTVSRRQSPMVGRAPFLPRPAISVYQPPADQGSSIRASWTTRRGRCRQPRDSASFRFRRFRPTAHRRVLCRPIPLRAIPPPLPLASGVEPLAGEAKRPVRWRTDSGRCRNDRAAASAGVDHTATDWRHYVAQGGGRSALPTSARARMRHRAGRGGRRGQPGGRLPAAAGAAAERRW
jgi:hypothetical protein